MPFVEEVDEYTLKIDADELRDAFYEAQRLANMKSYSAGYTYLSNFVFELLGEPGVGL